MKTGPAHLQRLPHAIRSEYVYSRINQNRACFPTVNARKLRADYAKHRRDGLPAWEAMSAARVWNHV